MILNQVFARREPFEVNLNISSASDAFKVLTDLDFPLFASPAACSRLSMLLSLPQRFPIFIQF